MTLWERGFEETTMNDIAAATGMAKPGLYANFGDKEALYAKALEHYCQTVAVPMLDDLANSPDPLDVVLRRYLGRIASSASNKNGPKGCLVASSLIECPNMTGAALALSNAANERRRTTLTKRIRIAVRQGALPADTDVQAFSSFFSGQALAISLMARTGASKRSLDKFIDVAMRALA